MLTLLMPGIARAVYAEPAAIESVPLIHIIAASNRQRDFALQVAEYAAPLRPT